MGHYGSIVIFPTRSPRASTPAARAKVASGIVSALEDTGLLAPGSTLEHDPEPTFATSHVLTDEKGKLRKLPWTHFAIEPELLTPAIGQLVYFDTAKNFYDEKDRKKRDLIAVPMVDVCVFSKPQAIDADLDGNLLCKTSVLLEFNYGDARLSDEIHRVRDKRHRFMRALSKVLGSEIKWGVAAR